MRYIVSFFLGSVIVFFGSTANSTVSAEKEACNVLVEVALSQHLATETPTGKYYCVPYSKSKEYFSFQLHYSGESSKDWIGSDLVGYYAVRRNDAAVLEWDFNNNSPGKVIHNNM